MAGIFGLFRRAPDPTDTAAAALCDAAIAKAREPDLYLAGHAPDTFEGRFGITALHGALLMRRLKGLGPDGLILAEKLADALFDRFDYALREEGVGDATIARKARKLGEEFYGLAKALDGVLASGMAGSGEVGAILSRNGLGGQTPEALADHVLAVGRALETCDDEELLCGLVNWRQ